MSSLPGSLALVSLHKSAGPRSLNLTYGSAACSPGFYGPILHKLASRGALKAFPRQPNKEIKERDGWMAG